VVVDFLFVCLFIFGFGGTGIWTQGLSYRQALYHLSHTHSPFLLFWLGSHSFCLGPALGCGLPTCTSHVAETTGTSHHMWLIGWNGVTAHFLSCLASNCDPHDLYLLSGWDYRCESSHPTVVCFFFFCGTRAWTQGLHLEPLHQPLFMLGIFEIGPHKLFALAGFKPQSSWSLSPE
jgi:hypothetical protein